MDKIFTILSNTLAFEYVRELRYCTLYFAVVENLYHMTVWLMEKPEFREAFDHALDTDFVGNHYRFGKYNILTNICDVRTEESDLFDYFIALPGVKAKMHISNNLALGHAYNQDICTLFKSCPNCLMYGDAKKS